MVSRAQKSKLTGRQAEDSRRDFMQLTSGASLASPATIGSIIREADVGRTRRLVEAICEIRGGRDLHLMGVEQTRRAAVAGKPWELRPGVRRGRETRPEVMDAVQQMLEGAAGFPDVVGQCQDAVTQPLAAFELDWALSEGQLWPQSIDWVHPKRFGWNTTLDEPGLYLGELRLLTDAEPSRGERLKADKWIVHQLMTQTDYPWRRGLGRALLIYQAFKGFAWKSWATWLELCAIPLRIAKVDPNVQGAERSAIYQALADLGSEGYAVLSNLAELVIESNGNNAGDLSFQRFIEMANIETSKAVLGHAGSADATPGRLGGETSAESIRQDLVESDARGIEASIRKGLVEPFTRLNFGTEEPTPWIALQVDAQVSRRERMKLAKEGWSMGMPIDREWLASATSIQLTTDPARMLPPPGPAGAAQVVAGVNAPQPNANPSGGVV